MNVLRTAAAGLCLAATVTLVAGCAQSPKSGTLAGQLAAVGGLAPGLPRPLPGTVVAKGPRGTHRAAVGTDGRFRLTLPPGTYTLTGTSPLYESGNVACRASSDVRIASGATSSVDVLCQER